MKKEFNQALVIFIIFIGLLWLEKPLRGILISFQVDELNAKFCSGLFVRTILICLALLAIKKLNLITFTGLNSKTRFKNLQAIILAVVFITFGLIQNKSTYISTEPLTLLLFASSVLAVGFFEEFVFRGTILPLCIKAFKDNRRPVLMAAFVSSSLFGIVHFVNLFSQPDNFIGITSQVFFALSIGVFFSGLMVRTENILVPVLIHALVNFSFGAGELKETPVEEISNAVEQTGINWNSVIPTTIFFAFIMAGGIFMILSSDKQRIMSTLEIEAND